jgi:D-alanyl-lipoteichoic acid acyltransferase DltB (MBOAT superfamily)
MLFNSFAFLGFFAVVAILYYAAPVRWRWVWLLIASYYFYSTFQLGYLLLLAYATLVAYAVGWLAAGRRGTTAGKWLIAGGVVGELAVLAVFKYFNFFASSLESALGGLGVFSEALALPRLGFLLPAGLSFYTFSAISYIVDAYRGTIPAERHLGRLALYIAFFPKLLAGPIERAKPFLEQIVKPVGFDAALATLGLQLMLWGLFKKVVIADRLAAFVDAGFANPSFESPVTLLIAVYFFAFQIYCDFSGYSDIAIGAAAVLGIRLMENFRRPYFAQTVPEFWSTRWHISLMRWFRDYIYIPMGGNRVSTVRWYANQMTVYLISGLWHGANWTFVAWGALNGLYQVGYFALAGVREPLARVMPAWLWSALSILLTFHLILLSWVFFRAASIADAWTVITRIFASVGDMPGLLAGYPWTGGFWLALGLIVVMLLVELLDELRDLWAWLGARPMALRWGFFYLLIGCLLVIGQWNLSEFVYMQF